MARQLPFARWRFAISFIFCATIWRIAHEAAGLSAPDLAADLGSPIPRLSEAASVLLSIETDVLVVGAGPTGLMLANQLGRRGVRALIIDRHAGPSLQTRALGVQARTLEIYAKLGIVERALQLGKRAAGANMWADGRWGARVPLGDIGKNLSPYPFLLILGQDDNERLMGDALRNWGMAVRWNSELVGLEHREMICDRRLDLLS